MESIENHISKDRADLEKAKKDGDTVQANKLI